MVVRCFVLRRRDVAKRFEQPAIIEQSTHRGAERRGSPSGCARSANWSGFACSITSLSGTGVTCRLSTTGLGEQPAGTITGTAAR